MFLRSFAALGSVDPGFRPPGVLTVQVAIPSSRYREPEQVLRFTSEWMEDIRRLPGVETVGLTSHLACQRNGQPNGPRDRGCRPYGSLLSRAAPIHGGSLPDTSRRWA
jgi:hypothetical protein